MGANTFGAGAAVVHVHGAHVNSDIDGLPCQWFAPGNSRTSTYPNDQPGSLIWYHDHAMGMTRLNVFAGLAGAYLILDPATEPATLPSGPYDLPLVIQDRMFDTNGQFYYPINPLMGTIPLGYTTPPWPGPSVPEFFGDTILVNGKVWPSLTVEARRYRLRILNGSQARFYDLSFTGSPTSPGKPTPVFVQIGAEGGYLPAPVVLPNILVAPAERADVIVDFTGMAGQKFILSNSANGPYPDGDPPDPQTTAQVMCFKVVPATSKDNTRIPATLPGPGSPSVPPGTPITEIVLVEQLIDDNSVRLQLGVSRGALGGYPFSTWMANPLRLRGGWNTIRFINTTGDVHPMHTHLFMFQVLRRQAFLPSYVPTSGKYRSSVSSYLTGQPTPPAANETGLKDTVRVNPGEIAEVLAYVDPAKVGQTYVIHCHILEHEEKDMMLAYTVV
jgi:spore coat protein A